MAQKPEGEEGRRQPTTADRNAEAALVRRLQAGEGEAYREAVRRFSGRMLATARGFLDPVTAEDVVQETWVACIDAIGKFEGRASLSTWLCTIVANRARNRLRKSARETLTDFSEALEPAMEGRFRSDGHWRENPSALTGDTVESLLENEALQDCLDLHIERLPETLRSVLMLREMQQMDADDVCNILAISASNMRVALHRARQRIFTMIEGFRETGEC